MKRSRVRLVAALPIALLALTVAGCSVGSDLSDDQSNGANGQGMIDPKITVDALGNECAAPGDDSSKLTIAGEHGEPLQLNADFPVRATDIERIVLHDGSADAPYEEGAQTKAAVSTFHGSTGEELSYQPEAQSPPLTNDASVLTEWAFEAVRCGADGQRVSIVMPAERALGGDEATMTNLGLKTDDSIIFVIDFRDQFMGCEALDPRDADTPTVDLGDGSTEPVITIPECMQPPKDLEIEVLVEGDGAVVETDEEIMTNYVGVFWNGAERFDGNWTETGIPFSTTPGRLISGFTQAMVGQPIGSTILVTMPSELGYDDGFTRTFVLQLVSKVDAN